MATFFNAEQRLLRALYEVLFEPADFKPSFIDELEDFMTLWDTPKRLGFRLALQVLDWLPFALLRGPNRAPWPSARFHKLPLADRQRLARRLENAHSSALRALWKVFCVLFHYIHYSQPQLMAAHGYQAEQVLQRAQS